MAKRWYYKDENGNKVPVPQYKINSDNHYTKSDADNKFATKENTDTKVAKTDIVQTTGISTTLVMSQKAVSDALSTKVGKTDIVQSTGNSTTSVMSQKAVSDIINGQQGQLSLKSITFGGVNGYCNIDDVVLSKDGDELEIELKTTSFPVIQKMWSFATYNGNTISIALQYHLLGARDANNNWLSGMNASMGQMPLPTDARFNNKNTLRITYADSKIYFYVGTTLVKEYTSQPTLKFNTLGKYVDSSGTEYFWQGDIYSFKYTTDGVTKDILDMNFTYHGDVVVDTEESGGQKGIIGNIADLQKAVNSPIIIRPKTSTAFDVLCLDASSMTYFTYNFERNVGRRTINGTDTLCMDIWNCTKIKHNGNDIVQGWCNFINRVGGDYHKGPGHGCEVMEQHIFFADGKKVNPTSLTNDLYCNEFRYIVKANQFVVDAEASASASTGNNNNIPVVGTDGTPVVEAIRFTDWTLSKNCKEKALNRLVLQKDGVIYDACYGSMLQGHYPYFNNAMFYDKDLNWDNYTMNNGVVTHNMISGNRPSLELYYPKGNTAVMFGDNYTAKCTITKTAMSTEQNDDTVLSANYYQSPDRVKIYLHATKGYPTDISLRTTFNTGDVIEVNVERSISYKE